MIAFFAVAALFAVVALLFVLPPLLRARQGAAGVSRDALNVSVYRDQLRELEADLQAGTLSTDRYEEARAEIERRLLADATGKETGPLVVRRAGYTALLVGLLVPLIAVGTYFIVGTPRALNPEVVAGEAEHSLDPQKIAAMVEQLAERMREHPENPDGWLILARSYNAMGQYSKSADAYRNALERMEPTAQILADYADTLAMAQGRSLEGEPAKLVARALKLDPNNVKALALAGTVAFHNGDYRTAAAEWERVLKVVPPDSDTARSIIASINEARSRAGIKTPFVPSEAQAQVASASGNAAGGAAAAGGSVSGEVRIAPALAKRIAPGDTLFIYAKAVDGPPMPLAILRKTAADLPTPFKLDDSMAMTPAGRISAFPEVVVSARVSKSGNAIPQSGDLEGSSRPLKVGTKGATIVIDRVVP